MEYRVAIFRTVIENAGLPDLRQLGADNHCKAAYRITVYHNTSSKRNSIATLSKTWQNEIWLEVVYERMFNHKPLRHEINQTTYESFIQAFTKARFDKLTDQKDFTLYSNTLWFVERVAGMFYHSVILSPQKPEMPYTILLNAIDDYLPEAIREVQ